MAGANRLEEELRREIRRNRISSLFKPANQFDGSTMPFQAWWRSFRQQLTMNGIPEAEWLGIVIQAMSGAAKAHADQQILARGDVDLHDFIEAMENSSFGFDIPAWSCRNILEDLRQGDSSIDEFSEAIQLLAPYVDDTSDGTMRYCLATNCHPYYARQLALVQGLEQMKFHAIKGLLKSMEAGAIRLREVGETMYGLPPLPNRKYTLNASKRLRLCKGK